MLENQLNIFQQQIFDLKTENVELRTNINLNKNLLISIISWKIYGIKLIQKFNLTKTTKIKLGTNSKIVINKNMFSVKT